MAATNAQWRALAASLLTTVITLVIAALLLACYYNAPLPTDQVESNAVRVVTALAIFAVVLGFEIWRIAVSRSPQLRAVTALVRMVPVFVILFAWVYLTMSVTQPEAFGGPLSRSSALYFTVTVFSTVGFGDITALSDSARLVVTVQMVCDIVLIGALAKLVMGTASVVKAKRAKAGGTGGAPSGTTA